MKPSISINSHSCESRRAFLKASAAGAVGIVAAGSVTNNVFAKTSAWTDRMAINPNISNLRVVCCNDAAMVKSTPSSWSYSNQNSAVDAEKIKVNLDEMAKSLAQKSTAAEAWAAIFRKPDTKQWSAVKVAIKFNSVCCGTENTVRAAVIGKVCDALIGLGVAAGNITAYDVDNSGQLAIQFLTPFIGDGKPIPAGVQVSSHLGGSTPSPVPGYGNQDCRTQIANGTIDILVNTGTNRGHGESAGFTLMLKSHMGTFPAKHGDMTYVTAMSKADAIVGGNPVRQQLCIVDSLFATQGGPGGAPDYVLKKLIMGTFAPTVDYLVARKIRQVEMDRWTPSSSISKVATDFGYTVAEFDALQFVDVPPVGSTAARINENSGFSAAVKVTVSNPAFKSSSLNLEIQANSHPVSVSIHDMKGRLVREFPVSINNYGTDNAVVWDGISASGLVVPAGAYVVKAQTGVMVKSGSLVLMRS
jgi:hypothetical protein